MAAAILKVPRKSGDVFFGDCTEGDRFETTYSEGMGDDSGHRNRDSDDIEFLADSPAVLNPGAATILARIIRQAITSLGAGSDIASQHHEDRRRS